MTGRLVGLFFDKESKFNPFVYHGYHLDRFLHGMTEAHHEMAVSAIKKYLLDEDNGKAVPLVTTAFWCQDQQLIANDSWDSVLNNGASLIAEELEGGSESAFTHWQRSYQMSSSQIALAKDVFCLKMAHPSVTIQLDEGILQRFKQIATDLQSMEVCRQLLTSLSIVLPHCTI